MTALVNLIFQQKIVKARLMLGFFIILGVYSCDVKSSEIVLNGQTMGTSYNIKIIDDSEADKLTLTSDIDSIFLEINHQMSTYVDSSEINQFNRYEGQEPFQISQEFYEVVERALYWTNLTAGAFDITINPLVKIWGFGPDRSDWQTIGKPSEETIQDALLKSGFEYLTLHLSAIQKSKPEISLDVNAIAKGFAVDAVSEHLLQKNIINFMVEIGGEVFCSGVNKDGQIWRIAIQSPKMNDNNFASVVALNNQAIATSGDYRNYYMMNEEVVSHIVDPKTGKPVKGISSVSVIADNCMDADALATALMVMGADRGLELIENLEKVEAMVIIRNAENELETVVSSGFVTAELYH